ncbi:ABC transporter ATP-binding protein [Streptomyces orinoci]|uniref:ABC transporter ATP-binding protein n=1 Tax=Streptomyces orinoci TaxID=67339 RepID=A0ABV3JUI0_STRON|nr:ABC transporter ATP-binding protein [Streptomyces orinoci]
MIEAVGLTKRYGAKTAVHNLTFQVRPGMVTGFLGPNGSGKSTTMRMILGLDVPTSGRVTIGGLPYRQLPNAPRRVGALLDAKAVHGGRSAYHHLLSLAQHSGIPARRVDEVLDVVGLRQVARKRSKGFSLGMGQRLGIAAALLGDPQVLLFDEPVNGLDPEGILWVRNLMKRLAAEGRTVFVSSHLMSEMALTAEHLIVIGRGQLLADMSVPDFIAANSAGFARVRTPDGEPQAREKLTATVVEAGGQVLPEPDGALRVTGLPLPRISDLAHGAGIRLWELSPHQASLEEAYMRMTQAAVDYRSTADPRAGYQQPAAPGWGTPPPGGPGEVYPVLPGELPNPYAQQPAPPAGTAPAAPGAGYAPTAPSPFAAPHSAHTPADAAAGRGAAAPRSVPMPAGPAPSTAATPQAPATAAAPAQPSASAPAAPQDAPAPPAAPPAPGQAPRSVPMPAGAAPSTAATPQAPATAAAPAQPSASAPVAPPQQPPTTDTAPAGTAAARRHSEDDAR